MTVSAEGRSFPSLPPPPPRERRQRASFVPLRRKNREKGRAGVGQLVGGGWGLGREGLEELLARRVEGS